MNVVPLAIPCQQDSFSSTEWLLEVRILRVGT